MNGLAPMWISGPLAMITLVVVAAHLLAMRGAAMPESRRRIRTANGWLILVATPVLAIAFSVVSPDHPRRFALVWAVAIAMLGLIIVMAFVDMANNLRLAHLQRRQFGRSMGHELRQHLTAARKDEDGR